MTAHQPTVMSTFWLIMFGSVLGFLIEGIWCRFKYGHWQSHPATVWGPFSLVYGIGAAAVYLTASAVQDLGLAGQFLCFFFCGTAVEYACSWFQEVFLKSSSWDYSTYKFNIGGRVSLRMSIFWGILGVLFAQYLLSPLTLHLDRMTGPFWEAAFCLSSLFMAVNLMVSAAALLRWRRRVMGEPAQYIADAWLDAHFDNARMKRLYSNQEFICDSCAEQTEQML